MQYVLSLNIKPEGKSIKEFKRIKKKKWVFLAKREIKRKKQVRVAVISTTIMYTAQKYQSSTKFV